MPIKLREPKGEFETFDWFMAEYLGTLPDSIADSYMRLTPERLRAKVKNVVIKLAESKGIRLTVPDDDQSMKGA